MLSTTRIVDGITVLTVTYAYDVFGYLVQRTETVGGAASVTVAHRIVVAGVTELTM